jgi:hypothetical protein
MARVLAITFDGLLQPIGYSQVARVAMALAARGHEYTVVSLEREAHLASTERARLERELRAAGVTWAPARYAEGGGGRAFARNLASAASAVRTETARRRPQLVHARSYHSALVAQALPGIPYVFDARGYWIDEQVNEGRRFRTAAGYAAGKRLERALYSRAAGVVTLTELHAGDVRAGELGPWRGRPVECIPTCADYDEFRPVPRGAPRPAILAGLPADARTIAIIGALNQSYLAAETFALAREVLARDERFRLVVLSAQRDEYAGLVSAHGIARERALVASVPHHAMPGIVPHLDWSVLLLREPFAKRGSCPTKLAELFASGVRVVQTGCNAEVEDWVERSGGGFVLRSTEAPVLAAAASRIVSEAERLVPVEEVRARTAGHFSLASGVARYDGMLRALS